MWAWRRINKKSETNINCWKGHHAHKKVSNTKDLLTYESVWKCKYTKKGFPQKKQKKVVFGVVVCFVVGFVVFVFVVAVVEVVCIVIVVIVIFVIIIVLILIIIIASSSSSHHHHHHHHHHNYMPIPREILYDCDFPQGRTMSI